MTFASPFIRCLLVCADYSAQGTGNHQKMAEISAFRTLRASRSSALGSDDLACERDALTAAGAAPEAGIGRKRIATALTRGVANILFANRITNANDHPVRLLLRR